MVLARFQRTIVDALGNVLPGAFITVRKEIAGAPLAFLYSDRAGAVPMSNPFAADSDGFAAFHTAGGAFRITATSGLTSIDWRYVPIGLAGETDATSNGTGMLFAAATADADPGAGYFRFNNATLASVSAIYIDNAAANTADISTWLDTFDDSGNSANRGTITIGQSTGDAFFMGRVTGSVVNGTGYRKISVTPLATVGTFVADRVADVVFNGRGVDGGDVVGPSGGVVDDEYTQYDGTTGKLLQGSGKTSAAVGDVRAAVANKVFTADLIETSSALVGLTDASTVAVDWDAAINFSLIVTANRIIGNPTNGQPGTHRTIYVNGNDATDRTITFGNQFLGEVPVITDADNGRAYLLTIMCITTSHFVVSAKRAFG